MKKIYFTLAILIAIHNSYAQNTFPGTGNVGIGTTVPSTTLDIGGNIQISGVAATEPSSGVSYGLFPYSGIGLGIFSGAFSPDQGIGIWTNPNGTKTEVMRILSGGNVGIGTTTPDAKLAVNGTIHSKEIKVDLVNWPDYVFKPDYDLPSLTNVKAYINKNQRLPEMPSEEEVNRNGVNLGEMNKLLVKKIEELTLYLIDHNDQDKKNEERFKTQKEELNAQQRQINQLKEQLTLITKL